MLMAWTECQENRRSDEPAKIGEVDWNDEILVDLTRNTEAVSTRFNSSAGSNEVSTDSRDFSYAEADYDMASKRILLRPRPPIYVW